MEEDVPLYYCHTCEVYGHGDRCWSCGSVGVKEYVPMLKLPSGEWVIPES